MNNLEISVVIPTYNEEKTIKKTLEKVLGYLKSRFSSFEIIVVDDGSKDKTAEIVQESIKKDGQVKLFQNPKNLGKGAAVKKGVLNSSGELILFFDADFSTLIEILNNTLSFFKQGFDILIGSRRIRESKIKIHQPVHRELMGQVFTKLANLLVVKNISDITCGFKCFTKKSAFKIFLKQKLNRWAFDVEILFLAQKQGFKIKEIPVIWTNSKNSKVKLIRDIPSSFFELLKIKLNDLKGKYN